MLYSFSQQLERGHEQERRLDAYFSRYFTIIPATRNLQRRGVDRIFLGRIHGQRVTVEYKADWTASSSGNAWLELRNADQMGWALKTTADYLVYLLPNTGEVIMAKTEEVRGHLTEWLETCEVRNVQDDGWAAAGLLVPLAELRQISDHTFNLTETSTCKQN